MVVIKRLITFTYQDLHPLQSVSLAEVKCGSCDALDWLIILVGYCSLMLILSSRDISVLKSPKDSSYRNNDLFSRPISNGCFTQLDR